MKWFQPLLDLVVKDKLVSERTNDAHQAVRQLLLLSPEGISSIMAKLEMGKMVFCYQNCSDLLASVRRNCSSLEQFVRTVKGQNNLVYIF